jgi:hypothetical protein
MEAVGRTDRGGALGLLPRAIIRNRDRGRRRPGRPDRSAIKVTSIPPVEAGGTRQDGAEGLALYIAFAERSGEEPHHGVAPMRKPWPFNAPQRDPHRTGSPVHLRGPIGRSIQRRFVHALGHYLLVVWPVLFSILAWQLALGFLIARIERWQLGDGVYFTFVTGLTIGYGDLVPHQPLSRFLAILIGFFGTVLTGLVAAIAVRALQTAADDPT